MPMALTIKNHLVESDDPNVIKPCKRPVKNKVKFTPNVLDTIIIHYTAGRSAASSVDWLTREEVKASAHIVIGREGEIYQLIPFDTIAWHAGESSYAGRTNFNQFSIGIELDNAGYLDKAGDGFVAPFGKRYDANEVTSMTHKNEKTPRYWHVYTEPQIQACKELCFALMNDNRAIKQILGHDEIAVGRKQDPGPAFHMDRFRGMLLGTRELEHDESEVPFSNGRVNSLDGLNIRSGAGANFPAIAKTLPLNKKLKIAGERNGWYRVKIEVEGWVNKAFVVEDK